MAMRTVSLDVPEELVTLLGSPEAAATKAKAKQALVLDLLREARNPSVWFVTECGLWPRDSMGM